MTTNHRVTIEQRVMASVFIVYVARALVSRTALKAYVLVLSVWGIGRLVWVSKVFENFFTVEKSGLAAAGRFLVEALTHTHTSVQLVLIVGSIAALSLALDVLRAATPRGTRLAA